MTVPLLVLAEFVFTEEGETEFLRHRDRTLDEVRAIRGCLQALLWSRPGRLYQFSTLWTDEEAVTRWVENEFHRETLMPGFREWCKEGYFGEYRLETDHKRARKCASCGRWTHDLPGWDERNPSACKKCGVRFEPAPAHLVIGEDLDPAPRGGGGHGGVDVGLDLLEHDVVEVRRRSEGRRRPLGGTAMRAVVEAVTEC